MIPVANVLILSNAPFSPSGYGTQSAVLCKILRDLGHEPAVVAFHGLQGRPITYDGVLVYPGSGEDPWATDVLGAHYRHFNADLLITLMDAWVLDPGRLAGMNVAHWMPVDCDPLSSMDRRVLDGAGARPIAMARSGEKVLRDAGYDPLYAPHSIDLGVWHPLADRAAERKAAGVDGKFVVAIHAANQDPFRKGFAEMLQAFALFAARHDDAVLALHTRENTRQGIDVRSLISACGISDRVISADQYLVASGMITDAQMARWQGLADVLMNCAWGEGFGLAVLQSQAVGTPVIVTDASAMSELCGAGWKVGGQPGWNRGHNAWWKVPYVAEIDAALEEAYTSAGGMREQAREFALPYDYRAVATRYWKGVLGELLP